MTRTDDHGARPRFDLIEQSRTLNLIHDHGDEIDPEQWWLQDRDRPDRMGSLAVAIDFEELAERPLRTSEIETVTRWAREYL